MCDIMECNHTNTNVISFRVVVCPFLVVFVLVANLFCSGHTCLSEIIFEERKEKKEKEKSLVFLTVVNLFSLIGYRS